MLSSISYRSQLYHISAALAFLYCVSTLSLRAPTRNPFNIGEDLGIPGQARDDGGQARDDSGQARDDGG